MATMPSSTRETITERLADHVVGLRYDDIPRSVVAKAKDHLIHHLGSAFRGLHRADGQQAVQVAVELSDGGGSSTIIGSRRRAHLLDAVFANAYLIHCVGMEDALLPQGINAGLVTQPVAWVVGESARCSGRELLTAVIAGYDVQGRLCDPALTWHSGEYRPAKWVLEPFGAAATAARLLGLSREQTAHALGYAGQVGRPVADSGPHVWTIHPLIARNGAMAAVLAKAGFTASPTVVEDEHGVFRIFFSEGPTDFVEEGLATLGREFAMAHALAKWEPASLLHVIPVGLLQRLMSANGLTAERVEEVEVVLPAERKARESVREARLVGPRSDHSSRRASLRFRVAIMLVDQRTDPDRFEHPLDKDLLAVLDKVRIRYETDRPIQYARVEVTTTDRTRHTLDSDTFDSPPFDRKGWLVDGAALLSDRQLTRLVDLVDRLEDVPDVSEVMACVVPEAPS
jgi:2-methylcitrate dehydratase PrpD